MYNLYTKQNKYVALWLSAMCFAIISMILIGGFTRLTCSGLSITEWRPVTGLLPPLTEELWEQEFNKYKESPEYLQINNFIKLSDFKSIFWVEFIHRIAGRVAGILYLLPLIYFMFSKNIARDDRYIYFTAGFLLILQGFAGWYMVKSGLISTPHVSHFRLAIHFMLAVILYMILFWQLMKHSFDIILLNSKIKLIKINFWLNLSLVLLLLQMIFGAFVAGLKGGLIYNNFPLMGKTFIPDEITLQQIRLADFSNPVFVQFIHRIFAYIVTTSILVSCFFGFKIKNHHLSKTLIYVIIALTSQLIIGVFTLLWQVPITTALLHQLGAIILLSCLLWTKYLVTKTV